MAHPLLLLVVALSQVLLTAAGLSAVTGYTLTTDDYVVGTVPTVLAITASFVSGVDTVGDTIVLTFNNALLTASATPTVTVTGGTLPTFSGFAVNGAGTVITGTLSGGSIAGGSATFTISSDLVALPAAGEQTATSAAVSTNTGGDTADTAFSLFYTLAAPTITLTTANMNAQTVPSNVQVIFRTPFAMTTGQTIVFTFSKAVLTSNIATGLASSGATVASYTSDFQGETFTATLGGNVAADVQVDFQLGPTLMAQLPGSAGVVTLDIDCNSITVVKAATGFGTIISVSSSGAPSLDLVMYAVSSSCHQVS